MSRRRASKGSTCSTGRGPSTGPPWPTAGIAFAMIKATQGTYDTQSTFAFNWQAARHAGVATRRVPLLRPDRATERRRRSAFLAVVGPLGPGDLPPMLDIECPDGDADCLGTGVRRERPGCRHRRADVGLDPRRGEPPTGAKPIVYTFASYFASNGIDPAGSRRTRSFSRSPSARPRPRACFTVPAPWSRADAVAVLVEWHGPRHRRCGRPRPVPRVAGRSGDPRAGTAPDEVAVLSRGPKRDPSPPVAGGIGNGRHAAGPARLLLRPATC